MFDPKFQIDTNGTKYFVEPVYDDPRGYQEENGDSKDT